MLATICGFAMMAFGAAVSLLVLRVIDPKSGILESRSWVQYFASTTHSSMLLAAIAAAAGSFHYPLPAICASNWRLPGTESSSLDESYWYRVSFFRPVTCLESIYYLGGRHSE